jgi:hypothetical protein
VVVPVCHLLLLLLLVLLLGMCLHGVDRKVE